MDKIILKLLDKIEKSEKLNCAFCNIILIGILVGLPIVASLVIEWLL